MSKRSLRKDYEHKNEYDFEDCDTVRGRRICKNTAHRKIRRNNKAEIEDYVKEGVEYEDSEYERDVV